MHEVRWKKLRAIAKSLQNGASLGAACEAAKINRITLWRWRRDNKELDTFIHGLLDNQIQVVEDALFKRAVGYRYEEETKEKEVGTSEKKTAKIVIKEVIPDVTAQMFFLMNRAPGRWADKRVLVNNTIVNQNKVGTNGSFTGEDRELQDRIRRELFPEISKE